MVLRPATRALGTLAIVVVTELAALPLATSGYTLVLGIDILVFALFAASLRFIMGRAGWCRSATLPTWPRAYGAGCC